MVNVLFIYSKPNLAKNIRYGFSMNIAYAASILNDNGFSTFFIDLSCSAYSLDEIMKYIADNQISVVAVEFDSFALKRSDNSRSGHDILKAIKQFNMSVKTIAFGFECIMEKRNVEYADITIVDDVTGSILSATCSLIENDLCNYKFTQFDFDSLPFPNREMIESVKYYGNNHQSTLVQTAKGCLNKCTFCQRQGWQNSYIAHDIEYVCREFRLLQEKGYKNVWIIDENFTFNLVRAKELLRQLIKEKSTNSMKLAISSWTKIDEEFLELGAEANIKVISMGIESANDEVLKFYGKDINLDEVKALIKYGDGLGIFMVGNFIIGAPMENEQMIKNTFSYIYESGLDQVNIKVLDYMIGSKLYNQLSREQYPLPHYFSCSENKLGQLPLSQLKHLKDAFLKKYQEDYNVRLKQKIMKYGMPYYPLVHN